MTFKEYTVDFSNVNIRLGYVEDNPNRVSIYINRMIFEIQDEMNLLSPRFEEEKYQFSLKDEQKLARKSQGKSRGSFIS